MQIESYFFLKNSFEILLLLLCVLIIGYNVTEAGPKRRDQWFHTFLNSDDEGMSFHGDKSTVAINQVGQVLCHGQ